MIGDEADTSVMIRDKIRGSLCIRDKYLIVKRVSGPYLR